MKLEKAINFYKQHGFLPFLKRIAEAQGLKFFKRSVIFYYKNYSSIPDDICEEYSFIIPTVEDIEKEPNYEDIWFSKEKTIERLKNGYNLFSYKKHGRMVYFLWSEHKNIEIRWLDYRFQIPNDVTYMTGEYVLPEYRRKGMASKVSLEVDHYLKNQGYKLQFSIKDPKNVPAVQVSIKLGPLGSKPYQIVNYLRIGFLRYYRVQKFDSKKGVAFFSFFKTPEHLWRIFLPGWK
jgi:GNAT superfamily N-acetyltransferase